MCGRQLRIESQPARTAERVLKFRALATRLPSRSLRRRTASITFVLSCRLFRRGDRRDDTEEFPLSQNTPAAGAAIPETAFRPSTGPSDSSALLSVILASLDDDKAEDVITIPLSGKSEMADHMVIASGRSTRQVSSIAEKLAERVKHDCNVIVRVEGKDVGDWVLIDAGDVIVHVFRPEVREFYQLEKMWLPDSAAHRSPAGKT